MQDQVPDIINTAIVPATLDVNWDLSMISVIEEHDTLVLSTPFQSGSAEEAQLTKMLVACKLTKEQFQIVQLASEEQMPWYQLREQSKATKVLLLGVLPAQLHIAAMMIQNEVNHFDGAEWMPTFSLEQIANNDALKKHLWVNVFQKVYLK
ncbi:MAG: hypothetical protein QM530_10995 [Phycisphaerales bacterium]|nr:hypothetical protein [Phycisphaerales bacterium]